MKSKLTLVLTGAILLSACFTQKQQKVTPVFPDAMLPHVKESYAEMWEKGRILYDINCAKCHNTVEKRKVKLPEFTEEMLASYEVRIADPKHEMSVSEARVNAEELNLITIFLTYRQHDSAALKKVIESRKDHTHESTAL
ncbi:MAG: hypothetical protein KDC07_06295 [Chitinophagaceae bacterium]|nr:hypothetical protein [Chitinophagaceae bacterium]MCB9045320.1 hypothetical protein [Chitinophagales bacterium]